MSNIDDDARRATSPARVALVAVAFGVPMGAFLWMQTGRPAAAAIGGVMCGVLFAVAIAAFGARAADSGASDAALFGTDGGETLVRSGLANHFKGMESVGGKLYLTDHRLRFVSHKLNVQRHDESYPLREITRVEKTRTLGIVPNGLRITLRSGARERFVLYDRNAWVAAVEQAIAGLDRGQVRF